MSGHIYVCGQTQSGKTHYAVREAERLSRAMNRPVLFIDTKRDTAAPWPLADRGHALADMLAVGATYRPTPDQRARVAEVDAICRALIAARAPCILVVDEAHLYAPNGRDRGGVQEVATVGLGLGIVLIAVNQVPAHISKAIVNQVGRIVLFHQHPVWGAPYWRRLAPDMWADVERRMRGAVRHSYCVVEGTSVTGPHREA